MFGPFPAASVRTMTTIGGPEPHPGPVAHSAVSTVAGCVLVAVVPIGLLHLVGSAGGPTAVDPIRHTLSDYVVAPDGYALLGLSAVALAAAGLVVAAALARAGLPRPRRPTLLLVSWSAALVVVAVFPTNAPGTMPDLAATVHRYAGAWVFAALPLVGWLIARRARASASWAASATGLAWWSGGAGLLSCAFLIAHLPVILGAPAYSLLGAVERVLNAVLIVVLLVTARAARRAAARPPIPLTICRVGIEIAEPA